MTFEEYQRESKKTATYTENQKYWYPALGLSGETGETIEKVKKLFRDDRGELTDTRRADITNELGDVLWYISQLATDCGISLEAVAKGNLEKLFSRKARGKITGDGDNR